jgi:hypothetical protein
VFRVFYVIALLDRISDKSCLIIMFNNSSIATCWIDLEKSLQKKWYKLKFSSKKLWFVLSANRLRFVFDNVKEFFLNAYDVENYCKHCKCESFSIARRCVWSTSKHKDLRSRIQSFKSSCRICRSHKSTFSCHLLICTINKNHIDENSEIWRWRNFVMIIIWL